MSASRGYSAVLMALLDDVAIGAEPVRGLDELAALDLEICTQPPPSWSVGVTFSGGTSPPRVKSLICSSPCLMSVPLGGFPPAQP